MTEKPTNRAFNAEKFIEQKIADIKRQAEGKLVLLALSGGVDSAVCAALIHKAIGADLVCVFVNTGLMRKNEPEQVERVFKTERGFNLICVDASSHFLKCLKGVSDPEQKRKIIGEQFVRVFEAEAKKLGKIDILAQGTIYPDVTESGGDGSKLVKSHHNVGGMPENMKFTELMEPVRELYKDEVRLVGSLLGLPDDIVRRQPFPGPGLGVRVIGEVTAEKLEILREADHVFRDEVQKAGLSDKIWQYFAVLPPILTTGIECGARTYKHLVALRAIHSTNAVTANFAHIPYEVLEKASSRITKEVKNVSRVVYDITSKPPATIEWE